MSDSSQDIDGPQYQGLPRQPVNDLLAGFNKLLNERDDPSPTGDFGGHLDQDFVTNVNRHIFIEEQESDEAVMACTGSRASYRTS